METATKSRVGRLGGMAEWSRREVGWGLAALASLGAAEPGPRVKDADIGDGLRLHYVEAGRGAPVLFVHGSLSDYSYWADQIGPFSAACRAIAYSRRHDWPNRNPARGGYSAIADADDLARLIERLRLAPAHIVGHSYGALAALFLAARRPEMVRTLTLAEPPAVSLLGHAPAPYAEAAAAMAADLQAHMTAPVTAEFRAGRPEAGIAIFFDYVTGRPGAWAALPPASRAETLRNEREWEVMLTRGTLFPTLAPEAVRAIETPTLLISGGKSYPFLRVIDETLAGLLPHRRRLILPEAGHQMWFQEPVACRDAVLALVRGNAG